MGSSKFFIVLSVFSLLPALGCGAADDDAVESVSFGTATESVVWTNGDDPGFFWQPSTQSALRAMAQGTLFDGNGNLTSTALATSTAGQAVLHYVIGCALPAGATLYSAQAGQSFSGAIGIAPGWAAAPLASTGDQRWMTACLLQTLNGLGVHVPIQLSGNNPALTDETGVDGSGFTVRDDTVFGNIFLAGGGPAYACTDVGLINGCGLQVSLSSLARICGLSPTCGMTLLGPCALACPAGASCKDPWGNSYPESISTTLQPTLAVSLYPLCHF